jgi:hypothetical protein
MFSGTENSRPYPRFRGLKQGTTFGASLSLHKIAVYCPIKINGGDVTTENEKNKNKRYQTPKRTEKISGELIAEPCMPRGDSGVTEIRLTVKWQLWQLYGHDSVGIAGEEIPGYPERSRVVSAWPPWLAYEGRTRAPEKRRRRRRRQKDTRHTSRVSRAIAS